MKRIFWMNADKFDGTFGKVGFRFLQFIGHVDALWFNVEGENTRMYKFHF